jgi:hypothetical protein
MPLFILDRESLGINRKKLENKPPKNKTKKYPTL